MRGFLVRDTHKRKGEDWNFSWVADEEFCDMALDAVQAEFGCRDYVRDAEYAISGGLRSPPEFRGLIQGDGHASGVYHFAVKTAAIYFAPCNNLVVRLDGSFGACARTLTEAQTANASALAADRKPPGRRGRGRPAIPDRA